MKCEVLTQKRAHHILCPWLKVFAINSDFVKAFPEEAKRCRDKKEFFALPKKERIYYTITLDNSDSPYLLVGIHSPALNISSVAKVTKDAQWKGTDCLKFFIENTLLNDLRNKFPQRHVLYATASTQAGITLFNRLKDNFPQGITKITSEKTLGSSFSENPRNKCFEFTRFKMEYDS